MKILLVVTTLWQGQPILTLSFDMPSEAECERQAAVYNRRPDLKVAVCVERSEDARRRFVG
jgi:hypothetical protein